MTASWGPERSTSLKELVPRALGVESANEVFNLVYRDHIGRSRIASAAKAVLAAAQDGDRIAHDIIIRAADDISGVLMDVVRTLRLEESDYALVASGGIAQNYGMFWDRICERASEFAPRLRPIRPKVRPCIGSALLGLHAMGVEWSQGLLARIEETQAPFLAALEGWTEQFPADEQGGIRLEYTQQVRNDESKA